LSLSSFASSLSVRGEPSLTASYSVPRGPLNAAEKLAA